MSALLDVQPVGLLPTIVAALTVAALAVPVVALWILARRSRPVPPVDRLHASPVVVLTRDGAR